MKNYYKGDIEEWDATILHQELKAVLSSEEYQQVRISGSKVRIPDIQAAIDIVEAHGSLVEKDKRNRDKDIDKLKKEVQKHYDKVARYNGFESINDACSFAAATNPYQAQSMSFVSWKGDCRQVVLDNFLLNELPSTQELIGKLPIF